MRIKIVRNLLLVVLSVLIANAGCSDCCDETLTKHELNELERAAENGNIPAMKRLYSYFVANEDPTRAAIWLKRAADLGDSEAELLIYEDLKNDRDPKQRELSIVYLQKSAERGSATAQWVLGRAYRDGAEVPKDNKKASYWLRKSARSGNEEAIIYLCDIALSERDVEQCRECVAMADRAVATVKPNSYYWRQLVEQKNRITEFLTK